MNLITASIEEICSFLASRIRAGRLRLGYSQAVMAKKTGIALRTYKRIELTGTGTIQNLIVILRTLERIMALKLLLPAPETNQRFSLVDRIQKIAEVGKANRS